MKMSNLLVLLAALCLFGACKGPGHYEALNNADTASALTDDANTDSIESRLVKTASMQMKVADVQKSSETIAGITRNYKGMVMRHHMQSVAGGSQRIHLSDDSMMLVSAFHSTVDLTLSIPSDSLEQFMNQVSHLGLHVDVRRMDVEDKTLDYLEAQMKLSSRSQIIHQQEAGKLKIKNPNAVLMLKDDMIDEKINNKRIDAAVKNSLIEVSLYQNDTIMKEIVANDDPDSYRMPFWSRLALALSNGCALFADALVGLTNLWLFVIAGGMVWLLVKWYRRKNTSAVSALKI